MRLRLDSVWRGGGLMLVALALALRLAVPTGFMVSSDAAGAAHLVICTGHGPAEWPGSPSKPGDSSDKSGDHVCVFAGHVAPTPPAPIAAIAPGPVAAVADVAPARLVDQQPGRGLAAPPPPQLGPPALTL